MKPLIVVNFLALTITICYAPGCRASPPVIDETPPIVGHGNRSPSPASKPTPTATPTPTASPSPGILTSVGSVQVQIQPSISPSELRMTLKAENQESKPLVVPMQIQATATSMSPVTIPIEVSVTVKQIDAGSVTPSPEPKNKEEDYIGHISSGDLLTLIVALAAYVAALRIFLTERRHDLRRQAAASMSPRQADKLEINESVEKRQDDPAENINKAIKRLIPADFLFVLAALLLSWRLFIPGQVRPYPWMIWSLFIIALLYLAGLHFLAWRKHRAYIALRDLLLKLLRRQ